jgi:hypothetical protein
MERLMRALAFVVFYVLCMLAICALGWILVRATHPLMGL